MLFPSTSGLLSPDGGPLTDDSLVAIYAESTAEVRDRDGNGDAVSYPDDVEIPLVGVDEQGDGAVAGVGAMLVNDGDLVPELEGEDPLGDLGNEEFLLNLYDEYTSGGTVLWDESHGQFYDLDRFKNFEAYAEENGYALESTGDLTADLDGAAAVVITSPADEFTSNELDALANFVNAGGLVVLHDQSDFSNFDQTANLNGIADGLDLGFRFNDGEVGDTENNVGIGYLPLTSNFNDAFPLFDDRPGISIDLRRGQDYDVAVDGVADGDTFDVVFDGNDIGLETDYTATVRVLGIDTPESAGVAPAAERPEEWEGLAYDAGAVDPIDELVFDSTASLLDANRNPLTDDSLVAVYAESTASNQDDDGNGDAVSYPEDTDIPLVAVDGNVAGLGAPFVAEEFDTTADNEEFLLNLYDRLVGGGTVLWDDGHGQFYDLASFPEFEGYAEDNGYTLEATSELTADLDRADAIVITSPSSAFTSDELNALGSFVDDGGAVILHDQSDFNDFDATANLNAIADALELGFRFNDDQVVDNENNGGAPFVPVTSNFAGPDALFETRDGIDDDPDARTTEYLIEGANTASAFAEEQLEDKRVTLFFDESEPLRDPTRLLAYAEYDADGSVIDPIDELVFDSTASLLDSNEEPLTDDSLVAVYAESTASNQDADGNGDAVSYPDDTDIPLVAVDGSVAGLGAPLVAEGFETTADNEEFLLNLYDQLVGGGTVLWDESHDQFYDLESFPQFEGYAEDNGYTLEATSDLTADLSEADAVVVTSPSDAFTDGELDDLAGFVADGGAVILHDQSDFNDFDATANLNSIAGSLGLGFRFNDDQVTDGENNGGRFFIPTTSNFAGPDTLFETRVGIGDGDGERETLYNKRIIEEGYGRAYGSGLSKHDEFWAAEQEARENGRRIWAESDISEAPPYREGDLDELFFPEAAVLDHARGQPRPQTVAVYSEPEAARDGRNSKEKLPLFGVDSDARVAIGGSLLIDESYERLEGFGADTSGYANFPFLSDVIEGLADDDRDDIVFIDGGHGQFGADYALSNEDAAYYQRHLEGRGVTFEQINDVTLDRLSGARALIVTTPVSEFTSEEAAAVRSFNDDGGAVVLLGSASAPTEATENLNALAGELGTGLRVGEDTVTDSVNNVDGLPDLPTATDIDVSPEPPRPPGRGKGRGRGPNGR